MSAIVKLSPDESAAVERLVASQTIGRAPRVQAVLSYLLERIAEGHPEDVSEARIGQAVFGRPVGYNPSEDNIVRVTVRHLRERLERYYETEGAAEQLVVTIPKGKYAPVFTVREVVLAETAEEVAPAMQVLDAPLVLAGRAENLPQLSPWRSVPVRAVILALFLGNAILAWHVLSGGGDNRQSEAKAGLLGAIFPDRRQRLSIVSSDADLQAYRQVFRQVVSLQSYLSRSYLQSPSTGLLSQEDSVNGRIWRFIGNRKDTTMSSARAAAELGKAISPSLVKLRHPRDCTIRDFENENVILLGGPWINPWGQLFEDRLNFRIRPNGDDMAGSEIVNTSPRAGESGLFKTHIEGAYSVSYSRVAMLHESKDTGKAVLVGANSEEALEAGSAFLAKASALDDLAGLAQVKSTAQLPSFEIVLEVKGLESAPLRVRIVAYRGVPD